MEPEDFIRQAELLTGTEVKGKGQIDLDSLATILRDESKPLDCCHLNELLLLVHKDRVEAQFFDYFFGSDCTVGRIPVGVASFQRAALLLFGNFAYAYRTLSRTQDSSEFKRLIKDVAQDPGQQLDYFLKRQPRLLEVDRIDRNLTPFVGYLSAREIHTDLRSCELLDLAAKEAGPGTTWDRYLDQVRVMSNPDQCGPLLEIIENYRRETATATVADLGEFLAHSFGQLEGLQTQARAVRSRATKNQSTYLTWDHMDVYFATSMRKAWEYEDLYAFIEKLMASRELEDLNLRYFDPTQAYAENRIDKGLTEALMLKRARCTVYSVQDTDTLGKDSELAATLAQGKPVIAFIPDLNVDVRVSELLREDPPTILERLRFVVYADERFAQRLTDKEDALIERVQQQLREYCERRIWLSIGNEAAANRFRETVRADLEGFCRVLAKSEKAVYDNRAQTLKEVHPLALQVNLETGVANGVLVVRTIPDCATLLRRILLSAMEFSLEEKDGMWYLREEISGCVYRVVTSDRKLSNCFWNFYLH